MSWRLLAPLTRGPCATPPSPEVPHLEMPAASVVASQPSHLVETMASLRPSWCGSWQPCACAFGGDFSLRERSLDPLVPGGGYPADSCTEGRRVRAPLTLWVCVCVCARIRVCAYVCALCTHGQLGDQKGSLPNNPQNSEWSWVLRVTALDRQTWEGEIRAGGGCLTQSNCG